MLLANIGNSDIASFDPATLTFTALARTGKDDINDEEGWHQLPSGTFLTVRFEDPSVLRNLRFRDQLVGDRRIRRGELGGYRRGRSRFRLGRTSGPAAGWHAYRL